MNKLLVVGSLNMDFVVQLARAPEGGETVLGRSFVLVPGGKGANQAYTAGKLGGSVTMIGAVGQDIYGETLLENLRVAGVDTSGVERFADCATGSAFISVDDAGENRITVVPGANARVDCALLQRHIDLFDQCDIVVMQMEIPLETIVCAAKLARERGKTVILDPAPAPDSLPDELYRTVDIIKPNEIELSQLSGLPTGNPADAQTAAQELLRRGVRAVIPTLGNKGALVVTRDGTRSYAARSVQPVDTTAAGDSFTAAFALTLSEEDYGPAVCFANDVAALVIQKKGAQTSIPTLEEVRCAFCGAERR